MEYILDGYNILFSFLTKGKTLQSEREDFLEELKKKTDLINLPLTLVFDAAFKEGSHSREHKGFLHIIYTSQGEIADDYIAKEVKHSNNPRLITVITNDNDLSFRVRQEGAKTEKVNQFLKWFNKRVENRTQQREQEKLATPLPLSAVSSHKLLKLKKKKVKEKCKSKTFLPNDSSQTDRYLDIFEKKFSEIVENEGEDQNKEVSQSKNKKRKKAKKKIVEEPHEDDFDRWLRVFEKGKSSRESDSD